MYLNYLSILCYINFIKLYFSFEKVQCFFNKQYRYKLWRKKMQYVFLKKVQSSSKWYSLWDESRAEKTPKSTEIRWHPRPPWAAVLPQFSMGGFGGRRLFDHWCCDLKLFINDGNHHKHSQPPIVFFFLGSYSIFHRYMSWDCHRWYVCLRLDIVVEICLCCSCFE